MTLKNRILILSGAGILGVALAGFFGYWFNSENAAAAFSRASIDNSEALLRALTSARINRLQAETAAVTRSRDLIKALQAGDRSKLDEAATPVYFRLSTDGAIQGLAITDRQGEVVFAKPAAPGREVLEAARASGKVSQGITRTADGKPAVMLAFPVYARGKPAGVAAFFQLLDPIAQEIADSTSAQALVLNTGGQVLFSTDPEIAKTLHPRIGDQPRWEVQTLADRHLAITCLPLRSAAEAAPLGALVLARDHTTALQQERRLEWLGLGVTFLTLTAVLGLLYLQITAAFRPITKAAQVMQRIATGDLTGDISCNSNNEVSRTISGMRDMRDNLRDMIASILEATDRLTAVADESAAIIHRTSAGALQQKADTDSVATAMTEMASTARDVAGNAAHAASAAREADDRAERGRQVVASASAAI
jgi:uncharacterized protein YoxC